MGTSRTATHKTGKKTRTTPIAIIGISGIFPQAKNKQEYWENILNKIDAITDIPKDRWSIEDYYDPDPKAEDKSYCKRGAFIPDIDFDPTEFGLPPNILEVTDVSQLLSLVVARDCLNDGGYGDESKYSRENVGVILGLVGIGSKLVTPLMARLQYPVWDKVLQSYGISDEDRNGIIEKIKLAYPRWEENSFPGSIGNVVAGRIANRFNLGGTNCVVDAACASSLAAIRMAVAELIEGRADMMISGGVDTDNSIGAYLCFSKTPAFSRGDRVRSFDQDSDGMMVGEGIGMVLMKRLEDAERDGDRIYAVIKGIGTSSDGRYKSIYAPRPDGQSLALRRAYEEAGYAPSSVGLIEAHGTGTLAGDPAEFQGLNSFFSENDKEKQHIPLGSVKSQIAHTKAAAGVASLIKISLAIYHKILPATINVTKPNSKLEIENSPFYINTEVRPWFRSKGNPRLAGISSFGFGGTNFHVVLEEYEPDHTGPYRNHTTPKSVILNAPTTEELASMLKTWMDKLASPDAALNFHELTFAENKGAIPIENCRIGFVVLDINEALAKLKISEELVLAKGTDESAEHPSGVYYRKQGMNPDGKVVALFPGQGSQYLNMGIELACNFPEIRQAFDEINGLFEEDEQKPLTDLIFPIPVFDEASREKQNKELTSTQFAQPAIGTLSVGLYRMLRKAGFKPDFAAGHSFGELTALWAAGVYSDDDYLFLTRMRGQTMAPLGDPNFDAGGMLAVKGDVEKLRRELESFPEVTLANWNSNDQVVLAGKKQTIGEIRNHLVEKGYSVVPLDVSAAFHTSLVGHAQKPFALALEKIKFRTPDIRVYSNTSAGLYSTDTKTIKQTLSEHILNPVLFKDEIETIYEDGGRIFVEIGPKSILSNLVKKILEGKPHIAISVNPNSKKDSDRQYREALIQLCVIGFDLKYLDPYSMETKPVEKRKSSINIKLNGGLYLTEKTKESFRKALQQKNMLHTNDRIDVVSSVVTEKPANTVLDKVVKPKTMIDTSEKSQILSLYSQLDRMQKEIAQIHEKFLANDSEFARVFSTIATQELDLIRNNTSPQYLEKVNTTLQILDNSITQFHQHQVETTRLHEKFLNNQHEMVSGLLSVVTEADGLVFEPASEKHINSTQTQRAMTKIDEPVIDEMPFKSNGHHAPKPDMERIEIDHSRPGPSASSNSINHDDLNDVLLSIVSEKTGYPAEMLELSMDMEADLGIDSIKRVEILGAMREKYPDLPSFEPSVLADMHTLGQIAKFITESKVEQSGVDQDSIESHIPTSEKPSLEMTSSDLVDGLAHALLAVVSEKTGYPVEMLEVGMDLEADLGIDSIKRVEILGAMQDQFPSLPAFDPAMISDIRTIGQIIEYISDSPSRNVQDQIEERNVSKKEQLPESELNSDSNEVSTTELSRSLMVIVSEKTGYPAEMLEPDMDMEADLGIDSIKRVEILGAMQEQFPQLPVPEASRLSEIHTLQQIVDSLINLDGIDRTFVPEVEARVQENIEVSSEIQQSYVNLKSIPYPDRMDVKLPENSITLITDDGTELVDDVHQNLVADGHKVVVLHLSGIPITRERTLADHIEYIELADNSETTLAVTLKEIQSRFGRIATFIHLDPRTTDGKGLSTQEQKIVGAIFLFAKLLRNDLSSSAHDGLAAFLTITRMDGQFGVSMLDSVEPVSAGLFGLTKTLSLEWEEVFCRAVDIHPDIPSETAAVIILDELLDSNHLITETGHTKKGRFTLVIEQPEGVA